MGQPTVMRFLPTIATTLATLLLAIDSVQATPSDPKADYTVSGIVRDYDNTPLADIGVFYFGTGANIGSTTTDVNGIYTFTLSADTYEVSVAKIGYPAPDKQTVSVPPSHTDLDFIFPQRYLITGHIRDNQSNPLSDALVAAFGTGTNSATALTDAGGSYTLTLKADTYLISVMKSGYVSPPQQSLSVPPAHSAVDFILESTAASITPSPTITFTPTPISTVMPTATSTLTSTAANSTTIYLPSLLRQNTATPVPSITPSPSPTASRTPTVTSSVGNHAPVFPEPLPITHVTLNELDSNGRLIGATTTITITAATDIDGDGLAYHWSATTGSIVDVSPSGLVGQWQRSISAGRIQAGKVSIVVDDGRGGTAEVSLNFP